MSLVPTFDSPLGQFEHLVLPTGCWTGLTQRRIPKAEHLLLDLLFVVRHFHNFLIPDCQSAVDIVLGVDLLLLIEQLLLSVLKDLQVLTQVLHVLHFLKQRILGIVLGAFVVLQSIDDLDGRLSTFLW